MTPRFQITANGKDITARLADRLLSLRVTDEDGETADRLEITLDDRDGRLDIPEFEARLTVALGFDSLTPLGQFEVESVDGSTPPQTMRITAVAVDLKKAARAPRTRAFEGQTLEQIVGQIAAEAGLTPVVGASIRAESWPYLAQTAESGLHFLTRLGQQIDATVKATGGRLVVTRRAEGKTASGEDAPVVEIAASALAGWSWRLKSREVDGTVEAEWSDTAAGQLRRITAGSAEPVRRLRQQFSSETEATRAAEAARRKSRREALEIDGRGAFQPALYAGGRLRLSGLRPEFAGEWEVTRVAHSLSAAGLATEFTAKREFDR